MTVPNDGDITITEIVELPDGDSLPFAVNALIADRNLSHSCCQNCYPMLGWGAVFFATCGALAQVGPAPEFDDNGVPKNACPACMETFNEQGSVCPMCKAVNL